MTAAIGWNNLVLGSAITAGSNAPSLPPSNITGPLGSASTAWQTAAGVVTGAAGAVLTVTPPATGSTWRVVGLFGTNLTDAASVTFELWNNPASPSLVWTGTYPGSAIGYGQVVAVLPDDTVADFLLITINDASNPDGFVNVPLVYAGPAWFPAGGIGFSSSMGRDDSTLETVTRGGQEYPVLLWQRRRWSITFDGLRSAEVWSQADPLLQASKTGGNVFFCPDSDSPYLQQEAIFGRLKSTADYTYPYSAADRRRWTATITERL